MFIIQAVAKKLVLFDVKTTTNYDVEMSCYESLTARSIQGMHSLAFLSLHSEINVPKPSEVFLVQVHYCLHFKVMPLLIGHAVKFTVV